MKGTLGLKKGSVSFKNDLETTLVCVCVCVCVCTRAILCVPPG